jgi:primosomal protein N' (replication factor Y)
MIANILPETKTKDKEGVFSYLIPENLSAQLEIGQIVYIPFGKQVLRGAILSFVEKTDIKFQLREIISASSIVLPMQYLELISWISKYYLCHKGQALSLFLPPDLKRPRKEEATVARDLEIEKKLSSMQAQALEEIRRVGTSKPVLLHGVTGSGKTEIYLERIKDVIKVGKQAIFLVPEIMLTPQTIDRIKLALGEEVAVTHSHLSASEKYLCWYSFFNNKTKIIVGPRSAMLVPTANLGLIVIDEEHEDSYKQEQTPRYHAVTLAERIAELSKAQLLMGSATPRVPTYHKTETGKYALVELQERFGKDKLPPSEIIDLKKELIAGNFSPISLKLQESIHQVLERQHQALLFLNRRGLATFVSCRDCGYVINCESCSIPMVFYQNAIRSELSCHHCGSKKPVASICPNCHSPRIKYFGAGTDRVMLELKKLFPKARIAQADSRTINSKDDFFDFYDKIKKGKIDLAVGTQMIAKGLDIPNVDLVGVISADTGLNMPSYRASEKTFQNITQVSGRSGRRDHPGQTIIQTYWPENPSILFASKHDYAGFYKKEIRERENFCYPPFCQILRVVAEHEKEAMARKNIALAAKSLKDAGFSPIGPAPAFYKKLHNKYRFHLLIKLKKWPDLEIAKVAEDFPQLVWDFEPTNML